MKKCSDSINSDFITTDTSTVNRTALNGNLDPSHSRHLVILITSNLVKTIMQHTSKVGGECRGENLTMSSECSALALMFRIRPNSSWMACCASSRAWKGREGRGELWSHHDSLNEPEEPCQGCSYLPAIMTRLRLLSDDSPDLLVQLPHLDLHASDVIIYTSQGLQEHPTDANTHTHTSTLSNATQFLYIQWLISKVRKNKPRNQLHGRSNNRQYLFEALSLVKCYVGWLKVLKHWPQLTLLLEGLQSGGLQAI